MTGDDHGNGGTAGRFDQFKALGPANCSVANWECVRGTAYIYASTPLTDAQVAQYTADGFEVGLHITTDCSDFTPSSLQTTYDQQVTQWLAVFPSGGPLRTQRHHCIVWSDWSSAAEVQLSKGMSVGHDEYWSGGQRANVTAARDAGVHLAFFSGNEIFWKTRWEPSIDGSNTANRTLVCYKETHANAKIDPSPEWTGTWRDPRFSPPADGGRPENELSGTIFMSACCWRCRAFWGR